MSRLEAAKVFRNEPYLIQKRRPLSDEEMAAVQESQQQNAERLRVAKEEGSTQKTWIAIMDNRTCYGCSSLHGNTIGIDDSFSARGISVPFAPLHPSCRCVIIGVE